MFNPKLSEVMDLIAFLNPPHLMRKRLNQTLQIMRLIAIIMLATCLQVSARGYSQITLSERDAPLEKVFREIQKQSGYDILCTYELLQQAGRVTVSLKNATLGQAVEECLKGKGLSYEIQEKTIVIKRMPAPQVVPQTEIPPPPPVVIHGKVVNHDGQPLADVSVIIEGTRIGTKTNKEGNFTISAPDNRDIVLDISSIGFQPKSIKVGKQTEITIALEDAPEVEEPKSAMPEVRLQVEEALQHLDPAERETLVLREVEGMSYQEIAELLDCSVEAVRSRLYRARQHFRRVFMPATHSKR